MTASPKGALTGLPEHGLAAIVSRHPAGGLAIGVVRDGHLSSFYGRGLADPDSG